MVCSVGDDLARLSRGRDVCAPDGKSRQRNTHITESREVRYRWHPWFGRVATVYEALSKGGHPVCRCGFDDQRNDRCLEVPAWMFDPASCDPLRLTTTPIVDCRALLELKTVLQTARRAAESQAQPHVVHATGGTDVTVPPPITTRPTDSLSSSAATAAISGPAVGHPGQGARLLRLQADQMRGSGAGREARHE